MNYPTPEEIRAARVAANLTQAAAAEKIYSTRRSWQDWESGARRMHPTFWIYFRLKLKKPNIERLL